MFNKLKKKLKSQGKSKQDKDASKERLKRCQPFVKDVLKILVEKPTAVGDDPAYQKEKDYKEITVEIISLMLQKDMHYTDISFTFQLLKQVLEQTEHAITTNAQKSFDRATEKLWDGKDIYDIKLSDIDKLLKE